jgi:hypothetical protein
MSNVLSPITFVVSAIRPFALALPVSKFVLYLTCIRSRVVVGQTLGVALLYTTHFWRHNGVRTVFGPSKVLILRLKLELLHHLSLGGICFENHGDVR